MQEPTDALDWTHACTDIPARGLTRERAANAEECAEIARQLDLVACTALKARYTLKAAGRSRYLFEGELSADVVQSCVITLEPLPGRVTHTFSIEFWPAQDTEIAVEGESEVLNGPDVEPIDNGVLRAGRVLYEMLAGAVDPFPRKAGAELDESAGRSGGEGGEAGPFAALARLKSAAKSGESD